MWEKDVNKADISVFTKPAKQEITALRIGVFGLTGSGKSHFALTAPPPVFVIDTEKGVPPLIHRRGSPFEDKDIRVADVLATDEHGDVDLVRSLRKCEQAIEAAAKYAHEHPEERGTIVLDTASELWGWYGIWLESEGATRFTKSGEMLRVEWGKVNRPYTQQMYRLILSGWNVVVTAKARELYTRGGEPMGVYEMRAQRDTSHWLDVVLEARQVGIYREFRTVKNRLKDTTEVFKNPTWCDVWKSTVGTDYEWCRR